MYYTGIDPRTMKPVYVARSPKEKAMQRALLQWKRPEKRGLVLEALRLTGRTDLIGWGKECLIRPEKRTGTRPDQGKAVREGPAQRPERKKGRKPSQGRTGKRRR